MTDVFALAAELVGIRSESHHESEIADLVEARLRATAPGLAVTRVGDNVVARTELGHERRIVLGGHLDTVPANDNADPRIEGNTLHGLGSADMKGGLAVLLALAEDAADARFDVSLVFYEAEEVSEEFNGLRVLFRDRADLVVGDLAILLEPTEGWVEAGCQGTLHLRAEFDGARAHSARPWMGENAIHRAADVLSRLAAHETSTVSVDGLDFRESLEVVRIEGGIANNVVPDLCAIVVNRRFAPKYSIEEAREQTEALLAGADRIEVLNASPAAPPNLTNPLVAEFIGTLDLAVRPKLGWTDVARFAAHGIPALNFGCGDPEIAHTRAEFVTREAVEGCYAVLAHFLGIATGIAMNDADVPPLVREALTFAEAWGFEQSCSPGMGRLLHVLAAQVRTGRIGELGTGSGVGAAWIASALEPTAELVTVELDDARARRAGDLFADLGNVTVVQGDWSEMSNRAPFELLFCDTVAPKVQHVEATIALLAPGGTIVVDDYTGLARVGDTERGAWLHHPHLVATEVLVSETEAAVVGVRR